jgi:hypothetical protein
MAFTGTDVKTLAQAEIDEALVDGDIIQNINACILEYSPLWRKTATQSITAADDATWYARTAGHLAVISATKDSKDYSGDIYFTHDRASVRFPEAATYVLTSTILPTLMTAVADAVDVNEVYKLGIARYCQACYKLKDNDQNMDGLRLKAEAERLLQKAAILLEKGDSRVSAQGVQNVSGW